MIKTRNGKTKVKGDILQDSSDLACIMITLSKKRGLTYLKGTCQTIIDLIEDKQRTNLDKILNKL